MAENLDKKPSKSILKNSSSFEKRDSPAPLPKGKRKSKETKWDEMNIIATLHPADKDYGHMKIEEPKTPYHEYEEGSDKADGVDASLLAERIAQGAVLPPRVFRESDEDDDSDVDDEETPEARAQRKVFESKRKAHYNEFSAVKLARSLMASKGSPDDDEDSESDGNEKADSEPSEKSAKSPKQSKKSPTDDKASGSK